MSGKHDAWLALLEIVAYSLQLSSLPEARAPCSVELIECSRQFILRRHLALPI